MISFPLQAFWSSFLKSHTRFWTHASCRVASVTFTWLCWCPVLEIREVPKLAEDQRYAVKLSFKDFKFDKWWAPLSSDKKFQTTLAGGDRSSCRTCMWSNTPVLIAPSPREDRFMTFKNPLPKGCYSGLFCSCPFRLASDSSVMVLHLTLIPSTSVSIASLTRNPADIWVLCLQVTSIPRSGVCFFSEIIPL